MSCDVSQAAKARQLEAILPACGNEPKAERDGDILNPAAKLAKAGWNTNSPAFRGGEVETGDNTSTPDKLNSLGASPQSSSSMTKRPRTDSRDGNMAKHTLPPPKRCTPPLAPAAAAPGSSRESAVAVDGYHTHANSELRSEYGRQRGVVRGQHVSRNMSADVEMLEVRNRHFDHATIFDLLCWSKRVLPHFLKVFGF